MSPFLSKLLPPGVKNKRKQLGGSSAPPLRSLKVKNMPGPIGLIALCNICHKMDGSYFFITTLSRLPVA